jgi:hypothetical protein
LSFAQQRAAFSQVETQLGNTSIPSLQHGQDRRFPCSGARFHILKAGFDDQSHGNSRSKAMLPA